MRTVVLNRHTTEVIQDSITVEVRERPKIESPDDVIVRIAGAGVCRSDLHILEGLPVGDDPVATPHVLGHENAGRVHEVGPAVTMLSPGDPVLCYPFLSTGLTPDDRYGLENRVAGRTTPGINTDGGYAEFLRINERSAIALPADADPAEYAPLADAGLAAYRAAKRVAALVRAGDTVMVVGVGGLGHIAVQLVRVLTPGRVVAVDPKPEARDLARRLGADETWATLAEDSGSVAAVIDFVASDETIEASIDRLITGGHYVAVGVGGTLSLPVRRLVENELTVSGSLVGTYTELVELTTLLAESRIEVVTSRYRLDDAAAALTDLREGRVLGRAVLIP